MNRACRDECGKPAVHVSLPNTLLSRAPFSRPSQEFRKDVADHRSLTESVLEKGEALLDCMASNSPGEEEHLSGARDTAVMLAVASASRGPWPHVCVEAVGTACCSAAVCEEGFYISVVVWRLGAEVSRRFEVITLECFQLHHALTLALCCAIHCG